MAPNGALDGQLYHHLLALENLQLASIDVDPDSLGALVKGLSEVQVMAKRGISEGSLTKRTLALARSIASAGISLANHLLGVERINADVEAKRQAEMIVAMDHLSLEDSGRTPSGDGSIRTGTPSKQCIINGKKTVKRPPRLSSNTSTAEHVLHPSSPTSASDVFAHGKPLHIAQSYRWLLSHLHNPYPPISTKTKIASEAGVSIKSVEDWFTNTRRRIGWTSVVKKFFRGCRAEAVDCAMCVLAGEPVKQRILSDTREALLAMRTSALSLFGNHSEASEIAKKIEATVKDLLSNTTVDGEVTLHQSSGAYADTKGYSGAEERCMEDSCRDVTCRSPVISRDGCASKKRRLDADDDNGERRKSAYQSTRPLKQMRSLTASHSINRDSCGLLLSPLPADMFSSALSSPEHVTSYPLSSVVFSAPVPPPCAPQMSRKRRNSDTVEAVFPVAKRLRELAPGDQDQSWSCHSLTSSVSALDNRDQTLPSLSAETLRSAFTSTMISSLPDPFTFAGLAELPAMPTFACNGADILPPSVGSFPSSSELFITYPELYETTDHRSPASTVFDDSQSLSSLELDFPHEFQLDTIAADSVVIHDLAYDAGSPSNLFQELLRIDREVKTERSRRLEEQQKLTEGQSTLV